MIFGIGMTISDITTRDKAKQTFWAINVWILIFIPMSIMYNILSGGFETAPYPIPTGTPKKYVLFWIVYILIGMVINLIIHKVEHR